MPRAKDVVMKKLDAAGLRDHAARKAVQLAEPFRVYSAKKRGEPKSAGHAVVAVDFTGNRRMVMEGLDPETAKQLKAMLEDAWVDGRRSAMLD